MFLVVITPVVITPVVITPNLSTWRARRLAVETDHDRDDDD